MPHWILSSSRRFVKLYDVDEDDDSSKDMSDGIYAPGEWIVWNREHVRVVRSYVL